MTFSVGLREFQVRAKTSSPWVPHLPFGPSSCDTTTWEGMAEIIVAQGYPTWARKAIWGLQYTHKNVTSMLRSIFIEHSKNFVGNPCRAWDYLPLLSCFPNIFFAGPPKKEGGRDFLMVPFSSPPPLLSPPPPASTPTFVTCLLRRANVHLWESIVCVCVTVIITIQTIRINPTAACILRSTYYYPAFVKKKVVQRWTKKD